MTAMEREAEQPVIQLDRVTFRYPGAEAPSLQNVSLSIRRGDFVAVAGSNGSGKSTLCKCFNGLIPAYYSGDMEGDVYINGTSTLGRSVAELSRHVAYVFQDFENQLVRPTAYDEACFVPLNFGYEDYKERGLAALRMLGIEQLRSEWIWQLSGGQKHMVALAAALSLNPEVIVIDEPVAQLDPAHARTIYDKLKMLNEVHGKTIVVIEHHTEFIADYCRTLVLMEPGGRVRWVKPVSEGLSAVSELTELNIQPPQVTQAFQRLSGSPGPEAPAKCPITVEEAAEWWGAASGLWREPESAPSDPNASVPRQEPPAPTVPQAGALPPGPHASTVPQSGALSPVPPASTVPQAGALPPVPPAPTVPQSGALSPEPPASTVPQADALPPGPPAPTGPQAGALPPEPLIRFEGVTAGYQGIDRERRPVLQDVDLTIHDGDRIALVGNNGAGKSTLLRLISGLRRPWKGRVSVCGADTRKTTPEALADEVAFLFQNPEEMFIADSIRKDIEFFLTARKREGIEAFVDDVLRRFKLTELQHRDGRLLSGGQQRRATLAIGMAMQPTVMLLDEPTASLDIASRRELTTLLDQLRDRVRAVVIATHDMQLVADWATRVIVMHGGRILLDADSRTVFSRPEVLELAALNPPQIVQLSARLGMSPVCLTVEEFAESVSRSLRQPANAM
ncbi:ABC transporter ATP-binding protein [Paenibacillus ginsengihumi]|uniref:ABC transporter ATP-binding protein n=1 Tax=Paenibacillus ginsengihumi TaxID=431596 RepID=UPI0003681403|nr:ABC transporter ATP-binding protein [Paenibacillus ginsengihumi]